MFTPAGGKSRVKRVARTSRLGTVDQPAISLVGPPSYSYGSPNNGMPIVPTLRDTGKSIASAFINESAGNEEVDESMDKDDVASQYSTTTSRSPRKRTPSLQDVQASETRRRSLRSASKSRGVPDIAEYTRDSEFSNYDDSAAVSLEYDVTQSSDDKTYDTYDERPSKVTQYDDQDSIIEEEEEEEEDVLGGNKTISDSEETTPDRILDVLRFTQFLCKKALQYPISMSRSMLYGMKRLFVPIWRLVKSNFWLFPLLLALSGIAYTIHRNDYALSSRLRNVNSPFRAPTELPGSLEELVDRLKRVEESLDSHWSKSEDVAVDLRQKTDLTNGLAEDTKSSVDTLYSKIEDLSHSITLVQERLIDMDSDWEKMKESLTDVAAGHHELAEDAAAKKDIWANEETLNELRQGFEAQRDLLAQVIDNETKQQHQAARPIPSRHEAINVLAQPDYASYLAGARINPYLTSLTYMHRPLAAVPRIFSRLFGNIGSIKSHPPAMAIHPSNDVGMCWAFPGRSGQLSVKLSHAVLLTDVAIEHVHPDIALDSSTAPREIEVWGQVVAAAGDDVFVDSPDNDAEVKESQQRLPPASDFIHLMDVTYNVYDAGQSVQVFAVPQKIKQLGVPFKQVLYRIKSNWGNEEFTCVYRVRAIGRRHTDAVTGMEEDETV